MKRSTITLLVLLVVALAVAIILMRQPGEVSGSGSTGATIAEFDSAAVDRIEVRASSATAVLEKQPDGWMLVSPMRYRADAAAVSEALFRARRTEVLNVVSSNPSKQSLFQVDSAGTLVTLFARGAVVAAFRVGKISPSFTETYVRRENSTDVFLTGGVLVSAFNKPPGEWRDRTIFAMPAEAITSVGYRFGDTTFTLERRDSSWTVDGAPAQPAAVQGVLTALSHFQADSFVDTTIASMPPLSGMLTLQDTQISFFRDAAASRYYVVASRGSQVFSVSTWKGDEILKRRTDLLGKK